MAATITSDLKRKDISKFLICKLCSGYLRYAQTLTECGHSCTFKFKSLPALHPGIPQIKQFQQPKVSGLPPGNSLQH